MKPVVRCDLAVVAENARAWERHLGVPVRAVVKADGYRWGATRLVEALDACCPAFCVADADELFALRPATAKPIVVLGAVGAEKIAAVLDAGGVPTIDSSEELAAAVAWAAGRGRTLRARVGVRAAAGWSGLDLAAVRALAPALAASGAEVETWTHVTDPALADGQLERLAEGTALLRAAGVRIAGSDAASTLPAAARGALGESVRIGIGLFGATGGVAVPGVRNALRIEAPIVRVQRLEASQTVGYGSRAAGAALTMASVRCGYSDGYPTSVAGSDDILSVGMQYAHVRLNAEPSGSSIALLGEQDSLDDFARRSNRLVHEIVTTLGLARTL